MLYSCSFTTPSAPRYALIYGIEHYANVSDLSYTVDDAAAVKALLEAQGYEVLSYAVNSEATKARILGDLGPSGPLAALPPDALVFFYFSGHGFADTVDGSWLSFIAPSDADWMEDDPNTYVDESGDIDQTSLVSAQELAPMFAVLPTRNVIAVFDTCYSGGFVDPGAAIDSAPQNYGPRDKGLGLNPAAAALANLGYLLSKNAEDRGGYGPVVISAAGSHELSWEWDTITTGDKSPLPIQHGIFSYFFIEAASLGDRDGDGYVTASEARDYAAKGVERVWNEKMGLLEWDWADGIRIYADFLPRISGGIRDLVIFSTR